MGAVACVRAWDGWLSGAATCLRLLGACHSKLAIRRCRSGYTMPSHNCSVAAAAVRKAGRYRLYVVCSRLLPRFELLCVLADRSYMSWSAWTVGGVSGVERCRISPSFTSPAADRCSGFAHLCACWPMGLGGGQDCVLECMDSQGDYGCNSMVARCRCHEGYGSEVPLRTVLHQSLPYSKAMQGAAQRKCDFIQHHALQPRQLLRLNTAVH